MFLSLMAITLLSQILEVLCLSLPPQQLLLIAVFYLSYHPIASQYLKSVILITHGKIYIPSITCPLTPEIPNIGNIVITSNSECELLLHPGVVNITVNNGLCNSMTNDLVISNYPYLESITIKAGNTFYSSSSTLSNLNSLTIMNNTKLKIIVMEDGYSSGSCDKVKSVTLSSIID